MSSYLRGLLEVHGQYVREGIINRNIIVDTLGEYNTIYGKDTDIETIVDQLSRECFGYSIKEIIDNQKDEPGIKNSKGIDDNLQPDVTV